MKRSIQTKSYIDFSGPLIRVPVRVSVPGLRFMITKRPMLANVSMVLLGTRRYVYHPVYFTTLLTICFQVLRGTSYSATQDSFMYRQENGCRAAKTIS